MKIKLCASILSLLAFFSATTVFADELDLYREARNVLGAKEKILLVSGRSRVVVWKDQGAAEAVGIVVLTELRSYPQEVFLTLPGYSVNSKAVSSRPQQCSWWQLVTTPAIIYACGIAVRPFAQPEILTPNAISELASLIKGAKPFSVSKEGELTELVFLIKYASDSKS